MGVKYEKIFNRCNIVFHCWFCVSHVHGKENSDCSIAKEKLLKAMDKYFNLLDKKTENGYEKIKIKRANRVFIKAK
jgi:hypothetical protein